MNQVAETAVMNRIQMEVKKDRLSQRQDGSWIFGVRVHPDDMSELIAKAAMGTRYLAVFVELNDDETPKDRRLWHELPPATQAAIRCGEKAFWQFLNVHSDKEAADAVRERCEVKSRADLSTDDKAKDRWEHLDRGYQEWLRQ